MAAAARIAELLGGDKADRLSAFAELEDSADAELAAASVVPLVEKVLCADESRVDAAEARHAYLALGKMVMLDPVKVGAELFRDDRWLVLGARPRSALGGFIARTAEDLTRDDLLLAACDSLFISVVAAAGCTSIFVAAERDEVSYLTSFVPAYHLFPVRMTDEKSERLMTLALEVFRDVDAGLTELELAGMWMVVGQCTTMRPAVVAAAVDAGLFDVAVATLRRYSPVQWQTGYAPGVAA